MLSVVKVNKYLNMKKMLCKTIVILSCCCVVMSPVQVSAINLGFEKTGEAATRAGYGDTTETTFASNVGIVIKAALSMAGVAFLALMVYAGYLWMTARGEEEPINTAKKIITACIIGLIIIAGAYSFTAFVVPQILKKTTGSTGGAYFPEAGGPKVDCCSFCDTFTIWNKTCPPAQQVSEADCKALGGKYLGLKPANECK